VTMEIEPEALDVRVPNLILQPLVENAIKYTVLLQVSSGHIQIRAQRINGFLRMQVEDDGIGLQLPPDGNRPTRGGVGIANTQARLKQLYGKNHRFELGDAPVSGVIVTLEIPAN
jgi:two-component system, LytTR family, sensor kinase